jgi:hypothetical protein
VQARQVGYRRIRDRRGRPDRDLVVVMFVVDWLFARFALRAPSGDPTAHELRTQTTMWVAPDTFTFIPALLALVVV